jgi:hypothetical protein
VRARNRRQARTKSATVEPPPNLTERQLEIWHFCAAVLEGQNLLWPEFRDTRASYAMSVEMIERLQREMQDPAYRTVVESARGTKANVLLTELRRWIALCRGLEADLLVNRAVWVRIPEAYRPDQTADDSEDEDDDGPRHDFYGEKPVVAFKPRRKRRVS